MLDLPKYTEKQPDHPLLQCRGDYRLSICHPTPYNST